VIIIITQLVLQKNIHTSIASGIGFLAVYAFGVYDGVQGYRQHSREQEIQPFVAISAENRVFGIAGSF
jgi:hypothetical protein